MELSSLPPGKAPENHAGVPADNRSPALTAQRDALNSCPRHSSADAQPRMNHNKTESTMTQKQNDQPVPQPSQVPATPEEDWKEQEEALDEALEETFPASDPIAPGHIVHTPKQ